MLYEVPLTRISEMADVSAEAFIANNDPIGNFMFKDEPGHLILKKRFFRSLVTSCSSKSLRQAISVNLEAISIWFPPGMSHLEDADVDPFSEKDFANPETPKRMQAVNEVISALTAHLGTEPQWYLHLVAVQPQFRGEGYSSQLIRPMLEKAAKENIACTLITQSFENARKYEHWGFVVVKEMPVPGSGEKFYSMRKG
ncbi:MAG: GNAT family N-acetyltransferase [Candidatus Omnitrophica bacterium]|nr:GNAT family N-acetyltransferase [Candidatus Omnitrophota bacterium]